MWRSSLICWPHARDTDSRRSWQPCRVAGDSWKRSCTGTTLKICPKKYTCLSASLRLEALVVFGCGDVGRLRGPAAQERELEHLIEPYAQHLDASSRTRATRPSLQNLVRPWILRPPMRAASCTGQSRPGGDHDHGANGGHASKDGPSRSVPRSTRVL